ncbi:MAG: tRNA (N6-threonylcarbamoyladenosine(37)-N6)-methyltransferase TrmO, partial [Chlamydiae bacterium]|nr:tRNA (N6-threonylcarbamoyladenosine(37)-N6)-methyltransferase TrmO [Chlamydiota bacterium]
MYSISIDSIGVYHRPAARKYELSRQPDHKSLSLGRIELFPKKNFEQALEGLSEFDRIWVVFSFDKSVGWNPKVRPPRGKKKIGLFATRSPHRPSSIGMSCVQLKGVSGRFLDVQGADLLDNTPILDIKPYIPYCDSFPDAKAGWVDSIMDSNYELRWSSLAIEQKDFLYSHGVFFSDYVF